jgi:O-antigen/teichoic acid export membrane protein
LSIPSQLLRGFATVRGKLIEVRSLVRLTPFDTATPAGRAQERNRRALLTTLAAMAAKIINVLAVLVSIPLTLHYLGSERFGLWMTISSLVAMLGFADLGIGNGLLTAISAASGKNDYAAVRNYVASGLAMSCVIAVVFLFGFFTVYPSVEWAAFLNVSSALAVEEAAPALGVLAICLALSFPLNMVYQAQSGLQQGFVSNLWQCAASLLGLGALLLAIQAKAGLPWLVLAMSGAPLLAAVGNSAVFFCHGRAEMRPGLQNVNIATMKELVRIGALFLVLQAAITVAFASDNMIIARMQGPDAVTEYAVPARMFSLVLVALSLFLAPLWPAYGEAIARADMDWVKTTLLRSLKATLLVSVAASLVLVAGGQHLLDVWVGPGVHPSFVLIAALGVWIVMEAVGNALAMFLNGAGIVKAQVIVATSFAVTCVLLKIFLVQHMGIAGIAIGTAVAYLVTTLLPYGVLVPRWLARRA